MNCSKLGRKHSGIVVIDVKPLRTLFQRNESRGGQDTRLTHTASEHLSNTAATFDELARTHNHGAHRRPKAFAQAELHGIEFLRHVCNIFTEVSCGIENPRSVKMDADTRIVRLVTNLFSDLRRVNTATCHVVSIFQSDKGRLRTVIDLGPDRPRDGFPT